MTVQQDTFPTTAAEADADARTLRRMERVLRWLSEHYIDQPSLEETASVIGLGPHHFQRLFTRYVGVSPKKYVQFLTLEHAKRSLATSASVLDAAFDAGLSGPGRLHDLFVTHEAMTPGEWKTQAAGLDLRYGWHDSPFGDCLIVASERGVCGLAFGGAQDRGRAFENLALSFGGARLTWDTPATAEYAEKAFAGAGSIHLLLRATPFQLKVWEALLRIPMGATTSYTDLASRIGKPTAARAVAGALAANPVSWLIPCHRVLRSDGSITGYRWSPPQKRTLLAWEAAQIERGSAA
ncbi:MAG: bifunctional helix-turn-helix domain-containing protein/methylated-DNA--[protein]-cysteine S-methyltransferase [Alphaproteobacteria bacterium]|nr:bifunctional helix-turn-helix domain-containing protein/methylated-DNA--[protein]-cysteine S-methyltransferase [Alphaproteobacteria bacterium]